MKHDKVVILRLTEETFSWLRENRALTGVNTNEFIRRTINMARLVEASRRPQSELVLPTTITTRIPRGGSAPSPRQGLPRLVDGVLYKVVAEPNGMSSATTTSVAHRRTLGKWPSLSDPTLLRRIRDPKTFTKTFTKRSNRAAPSQSKTTAKSMELRRVAGHRAVKSQLLCQLSYAPGVWNETGRAEAEYSISNRSFSDAEPARLEFQDRCWRFDPNATPSETLPLGLRGGNSPVIVEGRCSRVPSTSKSCPSVATNLCSAQMASINLV